MSRWGKSAAAVLPVLLLAVAVQLWSRYAGAPLFDFVLDDWSNLHGSREWASFGEITRLLYREADRPLHAVIMFSVFRAVGDQPLVFALLSVLSFSATMAAATLLVLRLTGERRTALLFALLFACLPNFNQLFQWATAVLVVNTAVLLYLLAALAWVRYLRGGGQRWIAAMTLCFAASFTIYEFGILLPAVFLLLSPRDRWRSSVAALLPLGAVVAAFLVWRLTQGFGTAYHVLYPKENVDIPWSLWLLATNGRALVSWWVGPRLAEVVVQGWQVFLRLPGWHRAVLALGNLATVAGFVVALRPSRERAPRTAGSWPWGRVAVFGLAWAVAGYALTLLAWPAARLNFFPGFGLALAGAVLLARARWSTCAPVLAVLVLMALSANQGTSAAWREAGVFNRRLYQHLQATRAEWAGKEVIYFNLVRVRQRLTPGLIAPPSDHASVWAAYGNAGLLRGYVTVAMIRLANPEGPHPVSVFDVENGPSWEDDVLVWNERYHWEAVHRTPADQVFEIDCFAVGADLEETGPGKP